MTTPTLTAEQEQALRKLKACFPYRICWATIAEDGQFETWAKHDKRAMNKHMRKGQPVWTI